MDKDNENYKNRKNVVKGYCHYAGKVRRAAHGKCNLNYKIPKDILIIIHDASYNTNFIINQLAEQFEDKEKIGEKVENMEKHTTFCGPIKKKCDDGKTVTCKLRFIDTLFKIYGDFIMRSY